MTTTLARETDDWAYDEAYDLHRIKGKLATLLDMLTAVPLPEAAEELAADLAGILAESTPAADWQPEPVGPEINYVF